MGEKEWRADGRVYGEREWLRPTLPLLSWPPPSPSLHLWRAELVMWYTSSSAGSMREMAEGGLGLRRFAGRKGARGEGGGGRSSKGEDGGGGRGDGEDSRGGRGDGGERGKAEGEQGGSEKAVGEEGGRGDDDEEEI